jgi:Zn-dependent protease
MHRGRLRAPARIRSRLDGSSRRLDCRRPALALVRGAVVADTNGKPEQLWKVALGGLSATALLALGFLAGTALPGPDATLFGLGFTVNAALLLTNLVPLRWLDGGQVLAGIKSIRSPAR